jgi:hypothetical protein
MGIDAKAQPIPNPAQGPITNRVVAAKCEPIHDPTPTRVSSSWHHIYSGIGEFDID